MAKKKETCVGCGSKADEHPVVAIAAKGDIKGDRVGEHGTWTAHPVCNECHQDPTHRKNDLKSHFFMRGDERVALRFAGSDTIGG